MTIASTTERNDYTGNGATSVYAYSFRILVNTELRVVSRNPTTGVETVLVLTTDYTVSGVGTSGGNVTLVAGALTSGHKLTIRRYPPLTQLTDIRNAGEFLPEIHEDQFDRLIMLIQRIKDEVDRSLKIIETEAGTAAVTAIGDATQRADCLVGFDEDGNLTLASQADGLSVVAELASDPVSGSRRFYWNTTEGMLKFFDGTTAYGVALI